MVEGVEEWPTNVRAHTRPVRAHPVDVLCIHIWFEQKKVKYNKRKKMVC